MAEKWNQGSYNLATRLGRMVVKAHGLIVAEKIRSVQRMTQAHTRDLLKMPGGKRKLAEAQKQLDKMRQLIKDGAHHG